MNKDTPQGSARPDLSRMELQHMIGNSPIAFFTCDLNGLLTYYNPAAAELWGRKPTIGKDAWCGSYQLFYRDGSPLLKEDFPCAKALRNEIPGQKMELKMQRPDGSFRQLLAFVRLRYNHHNEVTGTYCTLVDVSLQETEHMKQEVLSAIVESSDDAIVSKDLNGIINSWNLGAERLFGYTEAEALGQPITMLIPADRLQEEEEIINNIRQGKRVDHIDTVRMDKWGREIPLSISISPVRDLHGNVVGASKVARDISDRLQIEQKQAMLSAIVESSDDAIISKNLDGIIMSWNRGAEQIFGYSEAETVGNPVTMLIPSERIEEEEYILEKLKKGEKIDHFETIRKHKSGKEFPVSLTVSPIRESGSGKIIGASKVARDISLQVESQAALEHYTHNLEMLNRIGKSISENLDLKEIMQRVTDTTTRLTGATFGAFFYNNAGEHEEESFRVFTLSGAPMESFRDMKMPRYTSMFKPTFKDKKVVRIDDVRKHLAYGQNTPHQGVPTGHMPVVSYMAIPVVSKSGEVIGGLLYGHPEEAMFTEEHVLLVESVAAQAAVCLENSQLFERVKSLSDKKDEFIALASHELKTPLTTIKGYLQLLSRQKADTVTELFVGKSLQQIDKLNTLIEDMLNMSRIERGKLELNLEVFDLKELLKELTETFSYTTETHKILSCLGNAPAMVEGDRQRIEQAVINLMTNAIKYSPGADAIYVSMEISGGKVIVRVRDEGLGLSKEQQQSLFTRFYRAENTRGISGLGLGLYLTKEIIDRHKGQITVDSEQGKGSEFYFSLPLKTRRPKIKKAV